MSNLDSNALELSLSIPLEHACYADHFPNDPLVPGALLLKWILALIEVEVAFKVTQLKQIKFMAAIRPGDQVRIELLVDHVKQHILLDAFVADTLVIKGSLSFKSIE